MTLSEELTWRGFVNQMTYADISELDSGSIRFYWGVDPSADSMTIGNLAAAMMVRHFIDHGHQAYLLVGGATGIIGDPDGKKDERNLKTLEEIASNKVAISKQYETVFAGKPFTIVDNYDWFKDISYLDFLRNVGKHVSLSTMIGRDFVQTRIGEGGSGISYAEFSYSLIQGYDFLHLFREHDVTLQVAAADQWGNSITGVDLIRRLEGGEAHVYTTPLVVNKATGVKFGKSEEGAIWLDSKKTSVYRFYQFWLNVDDDGAADYAKIYTLLSKDEIDALIEKQNVDPGARDIQKTLAYEVTRLVHGQAAADSAKRVTEVLFGKAEFGDLTQGDLDILADEIPAAIKGATVVDLLSENGLAASKGEARRLILGGAISINGNKILDDQFIDQPALIKKVKTASFSFISRINGIIKARYALPKEGEMPLSDSALAHLSPDAVKNINYWLDKPKYAEYKADLEELIANEQWQQLEDSFFKVIEFGTAGRRGTTGIGSNRINKVTIGESAQALCEYARDADDSAPEKGIVIACDTRLSSPELSKFTAQVCAANGFKTYIFESFRSTPELSFAVRYLGAAAGIVISASHNPPADNGFKAYWSDGAQMVAPHDKGVLDKAAALESINVIDFDQALADQKIVHIGSEVDEAYIKAVVDQAEGTDRDVKIVYSPLHGAGQTNVLPALKQAGFTQISTVDDQMTPDGNFPTVENNKPNPQERAANDRAVAKMLAEDADIAITNDPDADRIGVMVRTGDEAVYLNGNESFILATDYVLSKLQQKGELTKDHFIARTIVTTDMVDALAKHYGVRCYNNLLVGFKYFGKLILEKEGTDEKFVIGGEESYGLLKGDYARDKDGATGALPMAEYAAELKKEDKTLYDKLLELYAEHGLYLDRMDNVEAPGANGFEKMRTIMERLQTDPPLKVGEHEVTAVLNYKTLERKDLASGEISPIDSLEGNVVVLEFGDSRRRITVRPSGTEPKMKLYVQWYEEAQHPEIGAVAAQVAIANQHIEGLSKELEGLLFS